MRYASQSGLQILIGQVSWEPDPSRSKQRKVSIPRFRPAQLLRDCFGLFKKDRIWFSKLPLRPSASDPTRRIGTRRATRAASFFRTLTAERPNLRIRAKTVRNETKPCETPRRGAIARGLAGGISG